VADARIPAHTPPGAPAPRFPWPDGSFDLVFATSALTRLREPDALNHMREIGRVLRPGGRCLVAFFLLNGEARAGIAAGRADHAFAHREGAARIEGPLAPDPLVAYDESWVHDRFFAAGLGIEHLRYGAWCGRAASASRHDIIVAARPG
jgi:SAM-dependent methyltransferase